ncbi:2-oxoglutarate and iron-dependent oxygenase domain-containing protein 2 isoform X1 [Carcharodon carcharias]|uniref:2-oxoglutarate and iron-dependent oxygenase domain-containing protein 2 isoform X1 n=1 Tax=Carcharodon carcharias TaxID=13397 RepID=UPI001B7F084B|nr:2-oxoglutarate and iron-dependent oxygenase domain-containing protein 2 isoform X1 [Carcharodon carcharias]
MEGAGGSLGPGPPGVSRGRFYSCRCFYTDNIFLEDFRHHVRSTEPELRAILRSKGCKTEEQFRKVQAKIDEEVQRRKSLSQRSLERTGIISTCYRPLNPGLYVLQESFLAPEFCDIVAYCRNEDADFEGLLDRVHSLPAERVYSIPVFTEEFCSQLIGELENFEQSNMPKGRPNTMNNYGVLLNELGFDGTFITSLREDYLQPITSLLYPDCGGWKMDSHKAFIVKYAVNQDRELSFHYDNAEVTLNVSLGKDFSEGNLYFGDMRQVPISESECVEIEHRMSHGLLHRGQHCHGALPISSGERWNLIIWMRSSPVRNVLCPMCDRKPELVEAVGFGDGFTSELSEVQQQQQEAVGACTLN